MGEGLGVGVGVGLGVGLGVGVGVAAVGASVFQRKGLQAAVRIAEIVELALQRGREIHGASANSSV